MAYAVTFASAGEKSLEKIDSSVARRIKPKILALAITPRPAGCVKLHGHRDLYRFRVGNYRVIYRIDDPGQLVEIALIAHRREVYRDF
jgi:mRNA interferase RelE/StbE